MKVRETIEIEKWTEKRGWEFDCILEEHIIEIGTEELKKIEWDWYELHQNIDYEKKDWLIKITIEDPETYDIMMQTRVLESQIWEERNQ